MQSSSGLSVRGSGENKIFYEEDLDWSDEESDYKVRLPPRVRPEKIDLAKLVEQPPVAEPNKKKEDHKRSVRFKGDAILSPIRGILPREVRQPLFAFKYPIPYLPSHVSESLGKDIIEVMWFEFLAHGCDASELIQISNLPKISEKMKSYEHVQHTSLPFDMLNFKGLEPEDYVEFREVCLQLVLYGNLQSRLIVKPLVAPPKRLPLPDCCAIDACRLNTHVAASSCDNDNKSTSNKSKKSNNNNFGEEDSMSSAPDEKSESGKPKSEHDQDEEKTVEEEDEAEEINDPHMQVVYTHYKMTRFGNVRLKHVPMMMEEGRIPYDKSRLPSQQWDLHGEFLIKTIFELEEIVDKIRTDKDEERLKAVDDLYVLPSWMESEFKPSEIMLFKHHFSTVDVEKQGCVNIYGLQRLTEQLGAQVTMEQSQELMDFVDLDGGGTMDFYEFMMLMYKVQNGVINLTGNTLAQAMVEAKSQLLIFEEIDSVKKNPPPLCKVVDYGGTPVACDFSIQGPPDSLYQGGNFLLRVIFQDGYPYRKPDITFLTRVYHINVLTALDGMGYLAHIKFIWDSSWSIQRLLNHIVDLMRTPQADLIPTEMTKIVRVFLWEKKEEARIAEELRLAELARLAEIARLEEEARLAEIAKIAERLRLEDIASAKRCWEMAGEDKYNELEIALMEEEDHKHPDDVSESSFGLGEEEEDKWAGEGDEENKAEDKNDGPLSARSNNNVSAKSSKTSGVLDLNPLPLSARSGPLIAEAKSSLSARGSARSSKHGSPRSARSSGSKGFQDEGEGEDKPDEPAEEKTAFGNILDGISYDPSWGRPGSTTSAKLMASLTRVEQMHLTVIQMHMYEYERYKTNVQNYVDKFAAVYKPGQAPGEQETKGEEGKTEEEEGEEDAKSTNGSSQQVEGDDEKSATIHQVEATDEKEIYC